MSRILIGWEIGAGFGHVERCLIHRRALEAAGHEVRVALRAPHPSIPDAFPAPSWRGDGRPVASTSLGAVLEQLGITRDGQFRGIVSAWEDVLLRERPDVVVADFAPCLLVAARGRARTILIGNGYDCPPSSMDRFPALRAGPEYDEAAARAIAGEPLPSLFGADHVVVGALPWIDPYDTLRHGAHLPPQPRTGIGALGEGIHVYWHGALPSALHRALSSSGRSVTTWNPAAPATWDEIAATSRVVVSHGGCGFTTQAALAAIPHLVVTGDLEKHHYGRKVREMGLGDWRPLAELDEAWAASALRRLHRDSSLHARVRCAARRMRGGIGSDPVERVVEIAAY